MKTFLIVDDNEEFLELLSSILQRQFKIYRVTGVQDAVKLLESITVDAICSDYNMRDGTGLDLLKMLRQQDIKIPFMLMSASDDRYLANKVQSWGASFCGKTSYELIDQIKAL